MLSCPSLIRKKVGASSSQSAWLSSYISEKPDNWHFKPASSLLASSCARCLTTLTYTFAQSFSFNHLQAKSTCLKKRSKHRNSGRIPSLIGSLTPAHGRLSRNKINNFCKRIISHPVKSQYLKYATRYIFPNMTMLEFFPINNQRLKDKMTIRQK